LKITFLGGGSFGTALAKSMTVIRDQERVRHINEEHINEKYLKGIQLPENLKATSDLKKALTGREIIVLAVPSNAVRDIAEKIKPHLRGDEIIVSIAKGIDPKTLRPLSETILDIINTDPVILSGPSHAEELALELPTTLVASSHNELAMVRVQEAFSCDTLRVYRNHDLMGVEIGGAVKNIIALAAGISDGIGYGDNAKAALMTRGMAEIIRMGEKMGADTETFYGLTGHTMDEATKEVGMVVEGIKATQAFFELAKHHHVDMPITDAVHRVLFEGADPKDAVLDLMNRELKRE